MLRNPIAHKVPKLQVVIQVRPRTTRNMVVSLEMDGLHKE